MYLSEIMHIKSLRRVVAIPKLQSIHSNKRAEKINDTLLSYAFTPTHSKPLKLGEKNNK